MINVENNVVPLRRHIIIDCPMCRRAQKLEYANDSRVYFPVPPFCCSVMKEADTVEWNNQLDKKILALA